MLYVFGFSQRLFWKTTIQLRTMTEKRSIQQHINDDKDLLENGSLSPQMRRHISDELDHLEQYQVNHPDEDHDPTSFEMYCDENPEADECRIYED